jgi:bacterioferritin-associated ferredoxin
VIICQCHVRTPEKVRQAMDDGARNLRQVREQTRDADSKDCGGCISNLRAEIESYFADHQDFGPVAPAGCTTQGELP